MASKAGQFMIGTMKICSEPTIFALQTYATHLELKEQQLASPG